MTISATPTVLDGCLIVRGKVVLTKVPETVVAYPASSGSAFLGASSTSMSSHHIFTLGVLEGFRLMSIFRFKIWWMIPSFGDSGSDVPVETQVLLELKRLVSTMMMLRRRHLKARCTFFFCLCRKDSSGPACQELQKMSSNSALKVNAGETQGTFSHVEDKKVPPHLDWFGWCTWDAFYTRVNPQGIREGLKSYLASCGVDGVKVDIQDVVEALGSAYGGRVMLTKKYQEALEESVLKNFKDNNLICSMSQNTDFFYSSKKSPVARVSEDYMPHVPAIQTSHVAAVAFNSFFQGEIAAVDWDMFQSDHITADFHAAARALGGCAVYVSDKPGKHDFKILKKLVLPDGSILRARYAGHPTHDCLFNDPVTDGKSLLKIWNMNKFSGVLGVFNCQGAGSWNTKIDVGDFKRDTRQDLPLSAHPPVSGHISPLDIESLGNAASETWTGHCAVYAFNSGALYTLPKKGNLKVSLDVLKYEIFTVCPIGNYGENFRFSPIGLLDMYNSGGAVESLKHTDDSSGCSPDDGLLTVTLPGECSLKEIQVLY
ncbi:UNVERIFIED_CONTAM: putative galactinol--sucrose galactosyltransferase 2 [Sesamum angustifolium]|uniref:Galactinol--sucrose galactosyltransferase 2 n=1 Tax=Sesamum angustifolium TaxID=2727405 RepID=A0AAW2Q9J8_9LAMI